MEIMNVTKCQSFGTGIFFVIYDRVYLMTELFEDRIRNNY